MCIFVSVIVVVILGYLQFIVAILGGGGLVQGRLPQHSQGGVPGRRQHILLLLGALHLLAGDVRGAGSLGSCGCSLAALEHAAPTTLPFSSKPLTEAS